MTESEVTRSSEHEKSADHQVVKHEPEVNFTLEIRENHLVDDSSATKKFLGVLSTTKQALLSKLSYNVRERSNLVVTQPPIHKNKFQCDHCIKVCTTKELIAHHMRLHFGSRDFKCDQCGKGFNRKHILERHRKSHLDLVKCEICKQKVKPNSMQPHMKTHEPNRKQLECNICMKKFLKKTTLGEHMMLHNSPDAFQCVPCGKSFKHSDSLNRHRKEVHEKRDKNYKCSRCNYDTNDKRNLTKHERKHDRDEEKLSSDVNWLSCKTCSALLKNNRSLWHHMKQVHPEAYEVCTLCGGSYKTKQHLRRHVINVHNKT